MNQYDVGMQTDFDNMTHELGQSITFESRERAQSYDNFETFTDPRAFGIPPDGIGFPIFFLLPQGVSYTEIAFIQPLKAEHEVVKAGELDIGDIKCLFKSDSNIAEEYLIFYEGATFKVQEVTIVRGLSNDKIAYIKAFGKKVAGR